MNQVPIVEKVLQARALMRGGGIDAWLTFVRETGTMADPALEMMLGILHLTWRSAFLIPANETIEPIAIVGTYDMASVKDTGYYPTLIGYDGGMRETLREIVQKHGFMRLAVNYSQDSETSDGLTHGMYLTLEEYLKDMGVQLVSSESILATLRSVKTPAELELMRQAANQMLEIFGQVKEWIKPGMTEEALALMMRAEIVNRQLESSWDEAMCPSVFTGIGTAEAHYPPSDRAIKPGHLVFIDCGVKVMGYCSDLQRTFYVLKKREKKAPAAAQKAFRAIFHGITRAAKAMKPGVPGWKADAACRDYIVKQGYDEYQHATGHGIGLAAHDDAAGPFPRWEKYGNRPNVPLQASEVYTIEPRVSVPEMGIMTVEEMVVVTPEGGQFLHPRQEKIIIV